MRVLLFGRLADAAGWRERQADGPASVEAMRAALAAEDPVLAVALLAPTVKAVLNRTLLHGDAPLAPGDELAFIPPVGGG